MRTVQVFWVDAFTRERFSGNPAGVVLGGDGLEEGQMRRIARELNCSETAFVLSPRGEDHQVWVRFFTPTVEVPVCGHASVAAHYVRAREGRLGETRLVQLTGAGLLPVEILPDGEDYRIRMTQGRMFAPAVGIPEDPVTGNAHGPLGAYLVRHGLAEVPKDGVFRFRGAQGDSLGRRGSVDVEIRTRDGQPREAHILGDAVLVFRAELEI